MRPAHNGEVAGSTPAQPTKNQMLTTKLYPGYKVYGPYTRNNDGRKQVSVVKGEHYITLQYAKFLIQEHIGRLLISTEEVHHIDEAGRHLSQCQTASIN